MRRSLLAVIALSACSQQAHAQFQLQDSTTTADLRGIASVGDGVAWASGSHGTVLRTEDGGFVWQGCATPPGAEQLDFRGIQAFDAQTALVMSSGKGDLSRVYKTSDGCRTWTLVLTNPDADGFFDAILARGRDENLLVLGDSVLGKIVLWDGSFDNDPDSWQRSYEVGSHASLPGESSFAASNSVLVEPLCKGECPASSEWHPDAVDRSGTPFEDNWRHVWFAAQVPTHSIIHRISSESTPTCEPCRVGFQTFDTPMSQNTASGGIFSLAFRDEIHGVAVGGDYARPTETARTASMSQNAGRRWTLSVHQPHGYRSSVAYNTPSKTWITVGPNGTDISRDDGRNWSALRPGKDDQPDADQHWNALSLPFVVGPKGRIGRLRDGVLMPLSAPPPAR